MLTINPKYIVDDNGEKTAVVLNNERISFSHKMP